MKSPKISIVIPSYDKANYIGKTLSSIISQEYPSLEVIIMDGGSNDGTLEIIQKFARKYPRVITYQSKKDQGQLDAINSGLGKATGEIVTFINADDLYEPGAFAKVAESFAKNPRALWFAGKGKVINSRGVEIAKAVSLYKNLFLLINKYSSLLVFNYLMQPSVFLTRNVYEKYGPFTGTEDFVTEYDLWLKIGKIRMPMVINEVLSKFRIEKKSKTSNMATKILAEDEKIVRKHSKNVIILLCHKLINFGRILTAYLIK